MYTRILNFVLNPSKLVFRTWSWLGVGSFQARLEYDVFPRPHYAFCVYHAARLAHRLGHKRVTVAELGVAGGSGLIELERVAQMVQQEFPITIEVYGFDTGEGLPDPVDYRDLPYIWKSGFYKMNKKALQARLKRSKLVLGDVKETVPKFFAAHDAAPLAAALFDLDFWSSTRDAFEIFAAPSDHLLPRVFCYCDDVISSPEGGLLNDYVGQLAAIREYNEMHSTKKLTTIAGLSQTRRIPAPWNEKIYIHHAFEHPDYNTYVHPDSDRQLRI